MSNNHAQDRYDPPSIGSEYEEQVKQEKNKLQQKSNP